MIFISKNLELLRKKAGFKQSELADKLGVKPNTISNYEKGVSSPDYIIVYKLMRLFNVTSDQLLYSDLSIEQTSRTLIKEEFTESVFDKFLSKIDEKDRKLDEKDSRIEKLQVELREKSEELAVLKAKYPEVTTDCLKGLGTAKDVSTKKPSSPNADSVTSATAP